MSGCYLYPGKNESENAIFGLTRRKSLSTGSHNAGSQALEAQFLSRTGRLCKTRPWRWHREIQARAARDGSGASDWGSCLGATFGGCT